MELVTEQIVHFISPLDRSGHRHSERWRPEIRGGCGLSLNLLPKVTTPDHADPGACLGAGVLSGRRVGASWRSARQHPVAHVEAGGASDADDNRHGRGQGEEWRPEAPADRRRWPQCVTLQDERSKAGEPV